jgi:hypothetical protein
MLEITDPTTLAILALADIVLCGLFVIAAEAMRISLRSVPTESALLKRQLEAAQAEALAAQEASLLAEAKLPELEASVMERRHVLLDARQRLDEAKRSAVATVYVLEQVIQPAHRPWLVTVRRGDPSETTGGLAGEWAAGRRFVIFSEDAEKARRRGEARFQPQQGYRTSEPEPFVLP